MMRTMMSMNMTSQQIKIIITRTKIVSQIILCSNSNSNSSSPDKSKIVMMMKKY